MTPAAHGGNLLALVGAGAGDLGLEGLPFLKLDDDAAADLEMILCGAFSPLAGFMGRDDYLAVLQSGRLADGTLWPLPVTLDVPPEALRGLGHPDRLLLLDAELNPVAIMEPRDVWEPDRRGEAKACFGTCDPAHRGARRALARAGMLCVGGRVRGLRLPVNRDEPGTPSPVQRRQALSGESALAWFPRRPPGSVDGERVRRALRAAHADHLLVFRSSAGLAGRVARDWVEAVVPRMRRWGASVAAQAVRMRPWHAGWRETLLQAIVAQNYGAAALVLSPQEDPDGRLGAAAASPADLRIRLMSEPIAATPSADAEPIWQRLERGEPIPESVAYPEVAEALRPWHPPRSRQGLTVLIHGLSGSGKSTLAHGIGERLERVAGRRVTVLDGDHSREWLTWGLVGTPADRRRAALRHARVCAEIARHGGVAVCALVLPDALLRGEFRDAAGEVGGVVEVHLAASAAACEGRDAKGLYRRGRDGLLGAMPGVGRSYDAPAGAEVVIDTGVAGPEKALDRVVQFLQAEGYFQAPGEAPGAHPGCRDRLAI